MDEPRHFLGTQTTFGWMHVYCPFEDGSCIIDASLKERYTVSLYFVMTALSSVGFGDIVPRRNSGTRRVPQWTAVDAPRCDKDNTMRCSRTLVVVHCFLYADMTCTLI